VERRGKGGKPSVSRFSNKYWWGKKKRIQMTLRNKQEVGGTNARDRICDRVEEKKKMNIVC